MTVEISRDGFFKSYPIPIADAYRSAVPRGPTVLWLRGDDESIVTSQDLRVVSWTDILTGNNIVFDSTNPAWEPPIVVRGSANNNNSIYFGGISTGLPKMLVDTSGNRLGSYLSNLIHLFIVFKSRVSSDRFQRFLSNNTNQNFGIKPTSSNASFKLGFSKRAPTASFNSTNNVQDNVWLIGEWQIKGNQPTSQIYINGQLEGSKTLSAQGTSSTVAFAIGGDFSGTNASSPDVEIAEIICINEILSDPAPVRNYLSLRYNIPLVYP